MNKAQLIEKMALSEKDLTKAAAGRLLDVVLQSIQETVAAGDTVSLVGFGTFAAVEAAARTARNPRTGEAIQVPAVKRVRFHAGKGFKANVNK